MTYTYKCTHDDCDQLDVGIRKCKDCGIVIITDRGIERPMDEFEIWMKKNGYVYCDGRELPNMFINTEWEESS